MWWKGTAESGETLSLCFLRAPLCSLWSIGEDRTRAAQLVFLWLLRERISTA